MRRCLTLHELEGPALRALTSLACCCRAVAVLSRVRHGTARHGTARHGTARHGTTACDAGLEQSATDPYALGALQAQLVKRAKKLSLKVAELQTAAGAPKKEASGGSPNPKRTPNPNPYPYPRP